MLTLGTKPASHGLQNKMADFKFNFQSEDNPDETVTFPDEPDSKVSPEVKSIRQAKEIAIISDFSTYLSVSSRVEEMILDDGNIVIKYVSESNVEDELRDKGDCHSHSIAAAAENRTDLIPSIYEGGLKIWECSLDLVGYLTESAIDFEGKRVLEIGCGAGLPGIFAVLKGAKVDFQDYNEDVIRCVTIPNVLLNLQQLRGIQECESNSKPAMYHFLQKARQNCRFFCGDWGSVVDFINPALSKEMMYDYILTSETIYSVSSYCKLYNFIKKHLKKPEGVVYVAAKTYYFGVGGGTRSFEKMFMNDGHFDVSACKVYSDGVQREILCLKYSKG